MVHLRCVRFLPGLLLSCSLLAGCHSRFVEATLVNHSGQRLSVVQVDYPSASFGTAVLAAGGRFEYRFKLQGSGNVKVSYVDASNHEHQLTGPMLDEGDEGRLEIDFTAADHADFHASMHRE